MTIITREEQKQILIDTANHVISRDNTSPYSENLRELARIALASLETKSVVWTDAPPVQETGAITESDAAHHAWNACHTAMLKRGYQMTAITKEWLQQTIAEFENTRDDIPFGLNDGDAKILIVLKRALAVIDAEPVRYLNKFSGTCVTLEQQSNAADDVAVYMPLYAVPPAPVVPDDWRLVPKNPTGPMLAAGYQAYMKGQHRGRFYRSYQAMLEAAPKVSGWIVSEEDQECPTCGNEAPEYLKECPWCGSQKCDLCDMGDDTACMNCEGE